MILLSEGNFISFYVSLIYFVASSGRRNWQQIEVYIYELVPNGLFVEEDFSGNLYCGSYSSAVNWSYSNTSSGWILSESQNQPVSSKHSKKWKQVTLNNLKESDTGFYTCSGRDAGYSFEIYSMVKVIRKSDEELHNHHNHGNISPNWIEVSKNSTVTLTCYSVNPVEWYGVYFNNQNKDIGEYTLTLFNLEEQHSGEYICRGFYEEIHTTLVFHAKARIIVDGTVTRVPGRMLDTSVTS